MPATPLGRLRRYQDLLLLGGGVVVTFVAFLTFAVTCVYALRQFVADQRQNLVDDRGQVVTVVQADETSLRRTVSFFELSWPTLPQADIATYNAFLHNGNQLFIANVKGIGSRDPGAAGEWNSHSYWGTATKVAVPDDGTLDGYTARVREDAQVPQALRAWERAQADAKPVPVPVHVGEPTWSRTTRTSFWVSASRSIVSTKLPPPIPNSQEERTMKWRLLAAAVASSPASLVRP